MNPCPCGSGNALEDCCLPLIVGEALAPTAEALMRSRYTAYSLARVDYILATYHPTVVMKQNAADIVQWCREATFMQLQILETKAGGLGDSKGTVQFIARIFEQGKLGGIHERSNFERSHGKWYYVDGKHFPLKPPSPNDLCPCGSGTKFKKCHGR